MPDNFFAIRRKRRRAAAAHVHKITIAAAAFLFMSHSLAHIIAMAALLHDDDDEDEESDAESDYHAPVVKRLRDEKPEGEAKREDHRAKRTRHVLPRPNFRTSQWAVMLQSKDLANNTSRASKVFLRRFRVPHVFFLDLVKEIRRRGWFPTAGEDVGGRQCIPVELKVLSALFILATGNRFDEVCKFSLMSDAMACATFHKFCKHVAEEFYGEHVHLPTGAAQDEVMTEYQRLGFPGAIGSTDVAHIRWGGCPKSQSSRYRCKEGFPTIAYQATVDHSGRVFAVTQGFPGGQNDKTIVRHDVAVRRLREDATYADRAFHLRNEDGTLSEHRGNYLIVGDGHNKWSTLISPIKHPRDEESWCWSKALRLAHKDVESFFGVLKGRFRILKLPILYRKREDIDSILFACCTLHNMLRGFEGLDVLEANVDWAGTDGLLDPWLPSCLTDTCSVGSQGKDQAEVEVEAGHDELRQKLITHFRHRTIDDDKLMT